MCAQGSEAIRWSRVKCVISHDYFTFQIKNCFRGLFARSMVGEADRKAEWGGSPADIAGGGGSQAFVAVWQQAIRLAQGVAEQALSEQRKVLAAERERVAVVEDKARQDAALARQHTMVWGDFYHHPPGAPGCCRSHY